MRDERHLYKKEVFAGQCVNEEKYWMNKIPGEITKSFFPYDFKSGAAKNRGSRTGTSRFKFTGELFLELMKLSNGSDARLHMILAAGLDILLNKVTRNTDIIIGSPILRQKSGAKFINTILALRNTIDDRMSFKELLLDFRKTIVEATEHQNYPLETLPYRLNMSSPGEDGFPLFDIAVLVKNIHDKKYIEHIPLNMIFSFLRVDKWIEGEIEFNASRYSESAIERIAGYYEQILQTVLSNIDIRLSEIDMLSRQEKQKILVEFNDTQCAYPADRTIHELFAEQVERTPDGVALVGKGQLAGGGGEGTVETETVGLTYRELNKRANQLARLLQHKGVGHDNIVGIMLGSSLEMIVSLLAILKAGGAYLPIDPDYPRQRKMYFLKDSSIRVLFIQRDCIDNTGIYTGDLDLIDPGDKNIYSGKGENLPSDNGSNHLAYVIYTSGTTGKPKGVLVNHQGVVNTLICRKKEYRLDDRHVSLQLFSVSFDGFVTNFFTPLICGTRVILLSKDELIDVKRIIDIIEKNAVTHFISVPTLFQLIVENASMQAVASLNVVTLAGDSLQPNILKMAPEKNKHIEIAHEYGVTEASVMSTLYRHQEKSSAITIGKPTANTKIYLHQRTSHLQPIGIPGELAVSGTGVARGYLNRPELTGEKFVDNPFSPYEHEKMYNSGDCARWLADGNIEFLGRMDYQVKIRGYRIEPGEIEKQLSNHHDIKEAVVVDRQDEQGQHYLCAYIVLTEAADKISGNLEIKEFLARHLPDYMIPPYFVHLNEIPLTPNGKIDRKALPEPEIISREEYIAPRNDVERKLANIYADVLKVDKQLIGIRSNFFDIGGYSLKATILAANIHKEFQVKIPLMEIFKHPTVMHIAGYIQEAGENEHRPMDENLVLLRKGTNNNRHIFFVHDGTGEVDGYMELCDHLAIDHNCWGIKAARLINLAPRHVTINHIAEKYIQTIKKVQASGPYYLAGWSFGGVIAYEMAGQLELMNESVGFLAMIDTYTFPGDLSVPGDLKAFSAEREREFLQHIFPDEPVIEDANKEILSEEIWETALDYVESNIKKQEMINGVIKKYNIHRLIPNLEQLSLRDKIHFINVFRSFHHAHRNYVPTGEIKAGIHFFKASENGGNGGNRARRDKVRLQVPWDDYSTGSIKTYKLSGDHHSILTGTDVINLANLLGGAINLN